MFLGAPAPLAAAVSRATTSRTPVAALALTSDAPWALVSGNDLQHSSSSSGHMFAFSLLDSRWLLMLMFFLALLMVFYVSNMFFMVSSKRHV